MIQNDFVWVVQFYAPWSIDSQNIEEKYEKLATDFKHKMKVGAVDGSRYKSLRDQYNVTMSPTIKIFGLNKSAPYTGLLDETAEIYKFKIINNNSKSTSSAGLIGETFKSIIECAMDEKARLESKFNNDDEDSQENGSGNDATENKEDVMINITTTEEESSGVNYEENYSEDSDEYEEIIDDFTNRNTFQGSGYGVKEETPYNRFDLDTVETTTYITAETKMADTSIETSSEATIEKLNWNKNESGITNSAINIKNLANITVTIILINLFKLSFIES